MRNIIVTPVPPFEHWEGAVNALVGGTHYSAQLEDKLVMERDTKYAGNAQPDTRTCKSRVTSGGGNGSCCKPVSLFLVMITLTVYPGQRGHDTALPRSESRTK